MPPGVRWPARTGGEVQGSSDACNKRNAGSTMAAKGGGGSDVGKGRSKGVGGDWRANERAVGLEGGGEA